MNKDLIGFPCFACGELKPFSFYRIKTIINRVRTLNFKIMKKVRINIGKVGVVTKNGDYKRVLEAGSYWLGFSESVTVYDMSKLYTSTIDLNIMLQDGKFKNLAEVFDVKDNEIVLKYVNDNFDSVLKAGRYFYFKGLMDYKFVTVDLSKKEITEDISLRVLKSQTVMQYVDIVNVESYEKAVLFIDGKFDKVLNSGSYMYWRNAISLSSTKVDLRQKQVEVSGQEILTKDKAALRVNFHAQYSVVDVEKAIVDNKDFEKQLYVLIQLALREFVGAYTLDELLENKESVSKEVFSSLVERVSKLGVKISDCGIRDIILPGEMKEIMNQVLVAQKKAQANIITRREETASTRSLLNTAKLMEDNAMLFKLKEMEYLEGIAGKIGEITVSGNGKVIDQLSEIFSSKK